MRSMLSSIILIGFLNLAAAQPVETCTTCHAGLERSSLRDPVRQISSPGFKDVHAAVGLGCVACHGGNPAAADALTAHATSFVSRPARGEAIQQMCGKCHTKPAESWLKGPHNLARAHERRPDCSTCHGAHGVKVASIDLIAEPLCSSCHTFNQASRIYKALFDAERDLGSLDAKLALSGNAIEGRARLADARSNLRGLTHSLDLMVITRNAAEALAVVDEVRAKELPKLQARDWGRYGRIALAVLAALVLLLSAGFVARAVWMRRNNLPILRSIGPREFKILGGVGAVLVIMGSVVAWRGNEYIEHDPKFCLSCHNMASAFNRWDLSAHNKIECHACHIPNTIGNIKQLWVQTTERPETIIHHADIDRSVCEKCHASGAGSPSKWSKIVETPGHRVHTVKARIECVQCHSTSVHLFKPPKELCVGCHKQITLKAAGSMSEMHCMQCHPFLAQDARRSLNPDRAACLDCHAKRQVGTESFPVKAPMRWDCGKCHKPHEKLHLANADCVRCHDAITEGLHKVKAHVDDCMGCHKPHGWTSGTTTCTACHKSISPERHHPGKACTECHGAWDDNWVKLAARGNKWKSHP